MLSEQYIKGSRILQLQGQTWQSTRAVMIYEKTVMIIGSWPFFENVNLCMSGKTEK